MTSHSNLIPGTAAAAADTGGTPRDASKARRAPRRAWRRLLRNPLTCAGAIVIAVLILAAIVAPWIAPYDPFAQDLRDGLMAPGASHWLGTDEYGRDELSRLLYGTRITLYVVALVSAIVGPIGLLVGTASGYFRGWVDAVFMRVTDIFISFPSLVLALAFVAALGPGIEHAVVAIALTSWPPIARLARAETLSFRNADFIAAVRLLGASPWRILVRHVWPLCLSSVIVRLTMNMATIILTAAGLGFLGLGAQAPSPEWGAMISSGRRYMIECWWLVAVPGVAIMLVSLAFNLLGDGLRDMLDPRGE
ncbi:peptide ABC transporter permease [Pandoraea terrae]|uniref:Peptide ABC transporter permease n=1 Tax=Pandoraea terrae TaxID=1537710 RepID=A0A5E4XJQ8_9BURK|nr:ABC transporter permease [Pandoraea terrae]VVE36557.1 peptide ABC transporter permease [Pandoraea terrae]